MTCGWLSRVLEGRIKEEVRLANAEAAVQHRDRPCRMRTVSQKQYKRGRWAQVTTSRTPF